MNQLTESMSQTPNYIESTAPKICCNQIGHDGEFISHVCLRADCQEQRAHCRKCNLIQHRQCARKILFIDEIADHIKQIDQAHMQIINIIERAIQKLQHVIKELNSMKQFIQQYSDLPSLSNLNKVAGILNYYSQQNIQKLLQGQDLLDNLIQSHYMLQLPKIVEDHIKNTKFNTEELNTPNFSLQKTSKIEINNENSDNNNSSNNSKSKSNSNTTNTNNNTNTNNHDNINNNSNSNANTIANTNTNTNTTTNTNTNNNQIPIDEGSSALYLAQAQIHYNKQEYAEALELFDLALIFNPYSSPAWNNKGTTLNKLERDTESIECFDKALEILNSKPQIDLKAKMTYIGNQASTLVRLGQFKDAFTLIDEGLALDPQNKDFFKLKIVTLIQSNQLNEALKIVDEAIQLDQNRTPPFLLKAMILCKLKKTEEAMDCYCMANSIKPKKKTYYLLGKLLEGQCQFDEAESCYKSALELDQNFDEAKKQLQIVQHYQQFK